MKHRPEYISVSSPYVRPALYAPPASDAAPAQPEPPLRRWARAVWVVLAVAALAGMFAYGVKTLSDERPVGTWVRHTPTTYGPPGPSGGVGTVAGVVIRQAGIR